GAGGGEVDFLSSAKDSLDGWPAGAPLCDIPIFGEAIVVEQASAGVISTTIEVGGVAIRLRTGDRGFVDMLEDRYQGFVNRSATPAFEFDIDLVPPTGVSPEEDIQVRRAGAQWLLKRGDFQATWDPDLRSGQIRVPGG